MLILVSKSLVLHASLCLWLSGYILQVSLFVLNEAHLIISLSVQILYIVLHHYIIYVLELKCYHCARSVSVSDNKSVLFSDAGQRVEG